MAPLTGSAPGSRISSRLACSIRVGRILACHTCYVCTTRLNNTNDMNQTNSGTTTSPPPPLPTRIIARTLDRTNMLSSRLESCVIAEPAHMLEASRKIACIPTALALVSEDRRESKKQIGDARRYRRFLRYTGKKEHNTRTTPHSLIFEVPTHIRGSRLFRVASSGGSSYGVQEHVNHPNNV